jgi:hypothetical protein
MINYKNRSKTEFSSVRSITYSPDMIFVTWTIAGGKPHGLTPNSKEEFYLIL